MEIREKLLALADAKYKTFHASLIPTVSPETILGVRQPLVRALAREIENTPEAAAFLCALPHELYDENALHGALICRIRDFDTAMAATEAFLPYIDNWAVCDMLSPTAFSRNLPALRKKITGWLQTEHTYMIRFAMNMIMSFFLDGAFAPDLLERAMTVRSEEFYVRMAQAWLLCTALCKQYDAALPYLTERRLDPWTHNKAISKCVDSRRISAETKAYLKNLRIPKEKEKP